MTYQELVTKVLKEDTPICKVCDRLHGEKQMCPRRVANAYTLRGGTVVQILGALTDADQAWMKDHPMFDVLDEIEDLIANKD